MRQIFKFAILLASVFLSNKLYSQFLVEGIVIDSKSKEPLAFVNLIFNNDPHLGTTTDIDGKFIFRHTQKIKALSLSYLGYKRIRLAVDSASEENKNLVVEMTLSAVELTEVEVKAGENPANRIIRKVIENKDKNNPENISAFKYTSYNKSIYDFMPKDSLKSDSIIKKMNKTLKGGHLFIMESVTERKFMAPDRNEEVITGVKVSGFKHPSFAPLATDLQPFSFYKDIIKIFDINYLNPIAGGSLTKYKFDLKDTVYQDNDTVFIISFAPLPNRNFEALTGILYIHTRGFAIQNVIAEPFENGLIGIRIQQHYVYLENKQWFPKQLNFEITAFKYPTPKMGTRANGKSYIENIELEPTITKKEFALESVRMEDNAAERDSLFWDRHRMEKLDKKEEVTYRVVDSIGQENNFEQALRFSEKAAQNKIPIGFIDLDISKTIVYNKFEGVRLGLGAYTNESVNKYLAVGGFFGYGLKDGQWKYGGEFIWTASKSKEIELRCKHENTLVEVGGSDLNFFNQNIYNYRSLLAYRMDRIQQNIFSLGFRLLRYAKLHFKYRYTLVSPQYNYQFQSSAEQAIVNYTNSDVTVNLRYAYKEKLINSLNRRFAVGNDYPVLNLCYTRGIKDIYNSQFEYNKVEARIETSFFTKNIGQTVLRLEAGYIDTPLPYGLLYTGEGSYDKSLPILIRNSFQTVMPYEFLSDRYVNLHFAHNVGALLFKTKKFTPHLTFRQSIGWGALSHPEKHQLLDFKTKERGFYESGIQVDNIGKFIYANVAYIGIGAGAYYRYGFYASTRPQENLFFKLSMTFSTK